MSNSGLGIAMDSDGRLLPFSVWLDRSATAFGISNIELAERYVGLRHLMRPRDRRKKADGRIPPPNPSRIKQWRAGELDAGPEVTYRLARAMEEAGAPVCGLDGLFAGHHPIELLGCIGSHIALAVAKMEPPFDLLAPEIAHARAMLDKLAPGISRELTIQKMRLEARSLELEEFGALQMPLPAGDFYPKEQTRFVDAGFLAWLHDPEDAYQKLPPSFAAAIALLRNPTPEVVELAARVLKHPYHDVMSLAELGMPKWVLRARGDNHLPERLDIKKTPAPDYTALNNFFNEFEAAFPVAGHDGRRQSAGYPHAEVRLCASEYHEEGTAIDIDFLRVDGQNTSQRVADVLEIVKKMAYRHKLKLITWPADDQETLYYRNSGFVPCHAWHAAGRRLEWDECAHKKEAQYT